MPLLRYNIQSASERRDATRDLSMFENLSDKLQTTFQNLSRRGRLREEDVDAALREVRLALLEADVNFRVVRELVSRIRERAVGMEVLKSLTPAQQVIKIVNEELVQLLGETSRLELGGATPHVIMLVGLQGSGKTTTAAKLGLHLRKRGSRPLLVAADIYRPAATTQLEVLARSLDIPIHVEQARVAPPDICARAILRARKSALSPVILDTAGRLHIDDGMMDELRRIKRQVSPKEILLVADAMTGQDAVRAATEFDAQVGLTGLILTKVDGDARGGAALSIRAVTGVPIKFLAAGEKPDALEPFYPDRMASRILGMGDVLTLIEKAEATFDEERAQRMERKLRSATFDLEDFLEQLHEMKKLGPMDKLLDMIPGGARISRELPQEVTSKQLKTIEALIQSMTPQERQDPRILNASRKRRIARGSGTTTQDLNQLLGQFRQMQRMMKQLASHQGRGLLSMFG
jgi:signal recognition particle subunit SRP54